VYAGDQDAALESNVFARENLVGSRHFGRPKETLEYALSLAPQGGMALEFGVASGNTLRTIARARGGEGVYSSAKTVLDLCGPRLRAGSIVHFDEFFNFPGWKRHEHRAWTEYVERTGVEFEYVAYTYNDNQVTVKITKP
jgi:hypothetical protein